MKKIPNLGGAVAAVANWRRRRYTYVSAFYFKKWDKTFQEEAGEDLVKLLCTNFLGETPECKDYRNYEEHQRLLEEVIFTQVIA